MDLHFLGCGAAFQPAMGNTAAYWAEGERLLLLDCGETVFGRLLRTGALRGVKEVYVAVSHLHSDHCGSLGSLALYCRYVLGAPLKLLVPDREGYIDSLRSLMTLYGVSSQDYALIRSRALPGFAAFTDLRYVPTEHAPGMECFSFVLETPEGGVFYSADTCTTEQLKAFISAHDHIHRIYMETTLDENPHGVHLSLSKLAAVLPPPLRGITYLMHLNSADCRAAGEKLGFKTVCVE